MTQYVLSIEPLGYIDEYCIRNNNNFVQFQDAFVDRYI